MTEGDNRNVMAAQLATEALGVEQVIAKINDPVRAEAYADLGLATICRTNLMLDAILLGFIGLARRADAGHPARPPAATPAAIRRQRRTRSTTGVGGTTPAGTTPVGARPPTREG